MSRSSISSSNAQMLSGSQWRAVFGIVFVLSAIIYVGWFKWERFPYAPNYRPDCWAERLSDYWSHYRWSKVAREHHKVFLLGDSVIWGQEVDNDQTISACLNHQYGDDIFANLGVDGLYQAGLRGLIKYYSGTYENVIIQFSPYWLFDINRDLRGNIKRFRHPRLVPQFKPGIHYNEYTINERLGYKIEHYLKIFPLVRHIMVQYYDNKSVAAWMVANPYRNPLSAITFQADEVIRNKRGKGVSWMEQGLEQRTTEFVNLDESIQWECFLDALDMMGKRNIRYFVLLGPYNIYIQDDASQERLLALIADIRQYFDEHGIPYYDADPSNLPSETFADGAAHMLASGHELLTKQMLADDTFRQWLGGINNQ